LVTLDIGQKFKNLADAWSFGVDYGGHSGFEVKMLVLMERRLLVDMCVLRRVVEHKTRGIMPPKILELKQEHVVQFG
jgi:hypothetical protein